MPQLDFVIAFPQIFWLIVIFISFYTILVHFFLPNFIKVLKGRRQIILENTNTLKKLQTDIKYKQDILNRNIELNLVKIKVMLNKEIIPVFGYVYSLDFTLIDQKLANVLYNNVVYYDLSILKSIPIKPNF